MKNTLQYAYTITVFMGVILTAYLMMNRDDRNLPLRDFQTPALRSEALAVDPGVSELFEIEDALTKLPKNKSLQKRVLSDEVQSR